MKAKKFLNGVRNSLREIEIIENNIRRTRERAFPGGMKLRDVIVQESIPVDRMADIEAKAQDLIKEMEARLRTLYVDRAYAEEVIAKMDNAKHRLVLTLYYLTTEETLEEAGENNKRIVGTYMLKWSDVANRLGYNENYTRILHAEALEEFDRLADL